MKSFKVNIEGTLSDVTVGVEGDDIVVRCREKGFRVRCLQPGMVTDVFGRACEFIEHVAALGLNTTGAKLAMFVMSGLRRELPDCV